MADIVQKGVDWQGINDFYGHLKIVWDKVYEVKNKVTTAIVHDPEYVPVGLQIWYDSMVHLYHMIAYTLTDAENSEFTKIIDEFDKEVKESDFITIIKEDMTKSQIIKKNCIKLNALIWLYLGKKNFLPKQTTRKKYSSIEEQIEDENA